MDKEIELQIAAIEEKLKEVFKPYIGQSNTSLVREQMEAVISKLIFEVGDGLENKFNHIAFKEGGRDKLVPANFFTVIVLAATRMGFKIPNPEEVIGNTYTVEGVGTISWDGNDKGDILITLFKPVETVTIDFTIKDKEVIYE